MKTKFYRKLVALGLAVLIAGSNGIVKAEEVTLGERVEEGASGQEEQGDSINQNLRHVYIYQTEDGQLIKKYYFKDGDHLLYPGDPTSLLALEDNQVFKGWYLENGDRLNLDQRIEVNDNREIRVIAKFESQYKVYFTYNGKVVASRLVNKGTKINPDNIYIDYEGNDHLDYWVDEEGEKFDFSSEIERNMTLKAVVMPKFQISFNSAGGSHVESLYLKKDEGLVRPADPERYGYRFKYWVEENDASEKEFIFPENLDRDLRLRAIWEAEEKVSYHIYHMVESLEEGKYLIKETENILTGKSGQVILPASQLKTFKGFSPDDSYNEDVSNSLTLRSDEENELIVRYKRNKYKFTMKIDLKGQEKLSFSDYIAYEAKPYEVWENANASAKEGQHYCWKNKSGGRYLDPPEMLNEDLELEAYLGTAEESHKHFIDEDTGETIIVKKYFEDRPVDAGKHEIPGYEWVRSEGMDPVTGELIETTVKKATLYPYDFGDSNYKEVRCYYRRTIYNLELISKYGQVSGGFKVKYKDSLDQAEGLEDYLDKFLKENTDENGCRVEGQVRYKFKGWYLDKLKESFPVDFSKYKMKNGDLVLYARWEADQVKIRVHSTNNEGSVSDQVTTMGLDYGKTLKDLNLEAKEGLLGWYYLNKGNYIKLDDNYVFYKDKDIYPIYKGASYKINYSQGFSDDNTYVHNSMAIIRPAVNHKGEKFIGWDDLDGKRYYSGDVVEMVKNLELEAHYEALQKTTTVVYDLSELDWLEVENKKHERPVYHQQVYKVEDIGEFLKQEEPKDKEFIGWKLKDEPFNEDSISIDKDQEYVLKPVYEDVTDPDGGNTTGPEDGNTTGPDGGNTTGPEDGNTPGPEDGNTTEPEGESPTEPDDDKTLNPGEVDPEDGKKPDSGDVDTEEGKDLSKLEKEDKERGLGSELKDARRVTFSGKAPKTSDGGVGINLLGLLLSSSILLLIRKKNNKRMKK